MAFQGVMLAKKFNRKKITLPTFAQPKLDGVRAIWDTEDGCFYTRNGNLIEGVPSLTQYLKDLKHQILTTLNLGNVRLDGELMLDNFNEVSGIVRRKSNNVSQEEATVRYHIYDYQSQLPYSERAGKLFWKLKLVFVPYPTITVVGFTKVVGLAQLDEAHLENNKNYEGTMYRCPHTPYEYKRSNALLKRKDFFALEAKPIAFHLGEGKYSATLGSIDVEVIKTTAQFARCLTKRFSVGSGLTDAMRETVWYNQSQYMQRTLIVKFQELSEYNIPRFPVFKGFTIWSAKNVKQSKGEK